MTLTQTETLKQREADALLRMDKHQADKEEYSLSGGKSRVPLISVNRREHFWLDIRRGGLGFSILKGTYQTRGRQIVPLARLDFGGPPHRNPDGEEIASPHLHLYHEGYDDKWAHLLSVDHFSDTENMQQLFDDFLRYCHIGGRIRVQLNLHHG